MIHVPDLRAAAAWILDQYTLSRSRSLSWEATEDDVFAGAGTIPTFTLASRDPTPAPAPSPFLCPRSSSNGTGAGHQFTLLPRPPLYTRLSRLLYH